MFLSAIIRERGNGFPDTGDYVYGADGELYQVLTLEGQIQTGQPGQDNWVRAQVRHAMWDECEQGAEFPASVSVTR